MILQKTGDWKMNSTKKVIIDCDPGIDDSQAQVPGCVINDPLAVAYFIDKSICDGIEAYTTVETEGICTGQTVVDAYGFKIVWRMVSAWFCEKLPVEEKL